MGYVEDGIVLWPLCPNWKKPITETLEFRTRVIGPTLTGVRQKRRMRKAPRRYMNFEVHPHHASRRFVDNLRFAQGKRAWAMPIWHDRQSLAASLIAGATSIPCATEGFDFAAGRYAVLRPNVIFSDQFEIVEVESVEADSITLAGATAQDWPAGTFLYPIRMARLADNSNNSILLSDEVSTLQVSFEMSEVCDWPTAEFASTYLGAPVWEFSNNWASSRNFAFNRVLDTLDNDVALPLYYDFSDKTFAALDASWMVKGRTAHSIMRSALYTLAGRYLTLWVPTLANDLEIAGTMASGASVLPVKACGYSLFGLGMHGRRDIRIELAGGVVYYRRITDSEESDGVEELTLNAPLGVEVSPTNVRRISFMMLMQQASDNLTITHHTDADGVTTAPLVFEGVTETS